MMLPQSLTVCFLALISGGALWGMNEETAGPSLSLEKVVVEQSGATFITVRLLPADWVFTAIQMDIRCPDQISNISMTGGTDLSPSKIIATNTLDANVTRILIYGFENDSLPGGAIVNLAITLKAGALAGAYSIEVSGAIGTDGTGHAVSLEGGAGAVIVPGGAVSASAPAPVITAVANAASYSRAAVAPGEIVMIGGQELAALEEAALVSAAGSVGTSLAGVRVLFDGIPAPLLYISATQVSAVVPYAVEGRSRTSVRVESQGVRSAALLVPVADAAPGIFTLDQSGAGQGAVVNQDGTLNGTANPARRGSIVSIFGTGEGQTTPAGADGMIVSVFDLRRPVLPVSVLIGGVAAQVIYAGSAPGQVAGLFQVNARIPETVMQSGHLLVAIRVGNSSSQAGVTMQVE